ncbi:MAG: head GIN domain-containing protein [Candidatus Zixiibacteriota bacterium]
MKKTLSVCLLLFTIILFYSHTALAGDFFKNLFRGGRGIEGSGNLVTEKRDIREFDEIESYGSFDIFVTIGESRAVTLTFDDNLIDIVETNVRGGVLKIETSENYSSDSPCKVEITLPHLKGIALSGSGSIEVVNLKEEYFTCGISGSGDIDIAGTTTEAEFKISGSGEIDARDLIADDVYVKISGSGDVRVHADESFDGTVSGSGNIYYYGQPNSLSTNVSGSGRIKKMK